ncbi:transposase [Nonomuraea endophytica]|uniref:transposase n=1 Tax=Nonomuraea endophytica TaxID=714136 RepID=UPI0037CB0D81
MVRQAYPRRAAPRVPRLRVPPGRSGDVCGRVGRSSPSTPTSGHGRRSVRGHSTATPRDVTAINTPWRGDITRLLAQEGQLYLTTIIDVARRIVVWATSDHLHTALITDALLMACCWRHPTQPMIFHSDCGCPYSSDAFAHLAVQAGVRLSVGRTGRCWDKALAESFFRHLEGRNAHRTALGLASPPAARSSKVSTNSTDAKQPQLPQPATCEATHAAWPPLRECPSKRNELRMGNSVIP